jgi:hypothetical protein
MEVDQVKNVITYKGRVSCPGGHDNEEVLTAYYDPEMKQMKQIIAEASSRRPGNRTATEKGGVRRQVQTVTLTETRSCAREQP